MFPLSLHTLARKHQVVLDPSLTAKRDLAHHSGQTARTRMMITCQQQRD